MARPATPMNQYQQPQAARPGINGMPQMASQPPQMSRPGQPPMRRPTDPRRLIFGCLGFFGCSIILFVLFVVIFVSQTSASGDNGLAKALGVDAASFTNSLILLTNIIFGLFALMTFIISIIGVFSMVMAKKDDKPARQKAGSQALVSGIVFFFLLVTWVGVYIFLSDKQINVPKQQQIAEIVTEPANTLLLTAPIDIKFDGTKIPNNPAQTEIISYLWTFGDGTSATTPVVTHRYDSMGANNGRYDATLTIIKNDKRTGKDLAPLTFSKVISIANVQLSSDFTFDPTTGPAPLTINFDGSLSKAPSGQITAYDWDFNGDNIFRDGSGAKTSYTFEGEGTYNVSLRITDNTGQAPAITTKQIIVGGANNPVAVLEIPTTDGKYYTNKQYTFYAEKSTSPNGKINKYEWDFQDGTPKANTRTATHTFSKAGNYEVILTITDETNKTGTISQKLKVENPASAPIAVIETVPAMSKPDAGFITGIVPFEVTFSAINSRDPDNNIVDYKWDFDGDGQTDTAGEQAKYIYKAAGEYNATVTLTDATGNISKGTLIVKVAPQGLKARLAANPVDGISPLTVQFDATGSSYPDGQIVAYEWDFGDGSPKRIGAAQVAYKFDKIGTFTIQVTAKASDGKNDTTQIQINIRPIALKACFTTSQTQGAAPLNVEFDPRCTTGTVAKYSWDFGDGETSITRKPTHVFQNPGSYQVTLEVADSQNVVNTYTTSILATGEVTNP